MRMLRVMRDGPVLVVEDSDSIREIFVDLLSVEGYEVLSAKNGAEALHALAARPDVSVVLLDLETPVMNGFAFRDEQLANARICKISVVAMSTIEDEDPRDTQVDAAAYLQKPVQASDLVRAINGVQRVRRKSGTAGASTERKPMRASSLARHDDSRSDVIEHIVDPERLCSRSVGFAAHRPTQ